jgi:hypothetical protein
LKCLVDTTGKLSAKLSSRSILDFALGSNVLNPHPPL